MSETERKLLAKLTDPAAMTEAWDAGIRPELFEEPLYGAVYDFILEYWRKAHMTACPTGWALSQQFPGFTLTDDASETTVFLADLLRRQHVTNRLQAMITIAATDSHADPIGSLKKLHAAAYAASEAVAPRNTRTSMATTIEEDKAAYEREEVFPQGLGLTYGLDLLDLHTGGLLPGELAVIGARAKTGKTMLGLHVMAAALRQGHRPFVFTLEMGLVEIRTRLAALFSGVSYDRLSHRRLSDEEKQQLWEGREELRELGDIQIESPEEGDRTVASLLSRARQYGADYLFIDQLSEMEPGITVRSLKEHHGTIMKQLTTEISRPSQEIPTILAAQLRRNDEVITLESFSNATEVEAYADILFGLWRSRDMRNNSMMAFDILGSRRSDTANYLLNWDLSHRTQISIAEERRP